ncbi:MAG: HlyD family type I secretion periplasmic adaptor subunit [Negativicutes bacterium]|jgi:hemolysin D
MKLLNKLLKSRGRDNYGEFLPAAIEVLETPPSPAGRLTLCLLIVFVVAAISWMIIGKVDEVASATGSIVPQGYVKAIQSERDGVINKILVTDGQLVKKGDILVELDGKVDRAEVKKLHEDLDYYNMAIDSMEALLLGIPFQPTQDKYKYLRPEDMKEQQDWFSNKQATLRARENVAIAQIDAAKAKVTAEEATRDKYAALLTDVREQERRMQELNKNNSIEEFQVFQYRKERVNTQQSLATEHAAILAVKAAVVEGKARLIDARVEFFDEINSKIMEDWEARDKIELSLIRAERVNQANIVRAPVDGRISTMAVHNEGVVVKTGEPLLTVVPSGQKLQVEAWIGNRDIGFIRVGQVADIKIATFDFQKYGVIRGKVLRISPDAGEVGVSRQENAGSTGEATNIPEKKYSYRATIELDQDYMMIDGQKVMFAPGMVVTAEVKTGKRRIIQYFLDTFRKYANDSLRER